jgi:hypothetical protein
MGMIVGGCSDIGGDMKRFTISSVLAVVTASVFVAAPSALAQTTTFQASFMEVAGRAAAHPCPAGADEFLLCGTGTVAGFGEATSLTELVSFENFDPDTNCADVVWRRTITLEDGSTLTLIETGVVCFPGNSFNAPGSNQSFGNPFRFEGTFTIVGGTGNFAGATGTGTSNIRAAGDQGHSRLSGSITLG